MKDATKAMIGILVGISLSLPLYAADFKEGEVIVKFKHSPSKASSMIMGEESRAITIAVDDTQKALAQMQARQDVEYVEPNYIIEAEEVPNDWPYASTQWTDTELPQAWALLAVSGPGEPVVVAVIDSGADLDHPDLQSVLIPGYDFANGDLEAEDDSGHGTRVCGIIGAVGGNDTGIAGVAWNVGIEIMPLKFMKINEGKTTGSVADAIEAIYYAVDNGADVINASWGFSSYSRALDDAITYARDRGVLFVASAGNSGQDNDVKDHYPSNYTQDNIIAVAAMNTSGTIASFSNYGLASVDIAAPGVGLYSTDLNGGKATYISGTSFATPFVTAVVAMVKSQSPGIGYGDLRSVIINSAATKSGFNVVSGGCLDAYQALLAEQSLDASSKQTPSSSQPDTTEAPAASSEGGGGGGGGCMIDSSRNSGSIFPIVVFLTLAVLFRMSRIRHQE